MYQAMARRYRPETFAEVIGQDHVAQTLRNAIGTERVAHAYLFCGPHGCGKTSMARIFAKSLVCEQGPTPEPCNACDFCKDIMRGQDVDVQEIDGASNNSVEQIRQLREQAGYVPTRARFKIYIIDEVHMLSISAFNALLKTLEEPPPHVKFILATTDPHKLPDTVISRCQRFDFRLVPPPLLAEFFQHVLTKETAEIDDEAIEAVAAFSGGSVRDGLVLLDQLLSYAQGKVTREDVERVRGVAGAESVAALYQAMVSHDAIHALAVVDEVAQRGTNVGDFLDQLIQYGRDLLVLVVTGNHEGISAYGPARDALDALAADLSLDAVLLMLDVLAQARTRVRSRALTNPLVSLEIAVARIAGLEDLESVSNMVGRLEALARGAGPASPPPAARSETAKKKTAPVAPEPVTTTNAAPAAQPSVSDEPAESAAPPPSAPGLKQVLAAWPAILDGVRAAHAPDLNYLHDVKVRSIEDSTLVLEVPGGGSFLFEQLEDMHRKQRLAQAATHVLGAPMQVRLVMGDDEAPRTDSPPPTGERARPRPSVAQRAKQEAQVDPAVRLVLDLFDGQVTNVEPEDR